VRVFSEHSVDPWTPDLDKFLEMQHICIKHMKWSFKAKEVNF